MRVLVACEESQVVCKAFRERGHEAYSCDILPTSGDHPEWHLQGDASFFCQLPWDLIIAHPPCTYSSNSGVRWLVSKTEKPGWFKSNEGEYWLAPKERWDGLNSMTALFNAIYKSGCRKIAMENPIPHKYAVQRIGRPDQIIQPWQFGHGETKATCLWLRGLPKLVPTNIVEGREQRIWKMAPCPERSKMRSKTYEGIAKAMAEQWG